MVPPADFTSYYGRPVVKAAPWEADVPVYFFLGGLSAGSSMLAAGADLSHRPGLRRVARLGAAGSISLGFVALVRDLGRPARFVNMFRVAKPTSPMSMGTWLLAVYGPLVGIAAAAEAPLPLPSWLSRALVAAARPAGLASATLGAGVATYTAVLLADTATPAWHDAFRELPFVFASSASAAAAGLSMMAAPLSEAAPARRLAVAGALVELVMEHRMEASMGMVAEPFRNGRAGRLRRVANVLTVSGAAGAALVAGRSRRGAVAAGAALLAGSLCLRLSTFEAGQASARDPRYTVVPQRERLEARRPD